MTQSPGTLHTPHTPETIAAIATAPGQAGVGIVRVSGPLATTIAAAMLGYTPKPRYAHYGAFLDQKGEIIDEGIGLFFPNPHSFTGEDVFELQGHGGTVILDLLLREVCSLGARLGHTFAYTWKQPSISPRKRSIFWPMAK
jgi:tRNA modification GTPase